MLSRFIFTTLFNLDLFISYFELLILCFLLLLYAFLFVCSFEFRLRIALGPGGDLMLTSRIRNTNSEGKPFSFTFAYHTYFSVSDIRLVLEICFSHTLSHFSDDFVFFIY